MVIRCKLIKTAVLFDSQIDNNQSTEAIKTVITLGDCEQELHLVTSNQCLSLSWSTKM